jgi:polysaccharide pyruvyl transferase WcaK-like protein
MLRAARWSTKGWPELGLLPAEISLLHTLSRADVFHISGGGFLTGMTQSRLWENALLMQLCHILETPVILSGQTIGVFRSNKDRSLATAALKQAKLIYLRDPGGSETDVRELEIEGDHIVSLFDDALFCDSCDEQLAVQTLAENGIDPDQPFVVVNYHYWGMSPELKSRSQQRFSEVCDWVQTKHGLQVLFIPMSPPDEGAELAVQKGMSTPAPLLAYNYDYRVARGIIARASFVLTMKHHPIIFSQGEAVPAVAVALDDYYYRKNYGAMANCGQEQFCLDTTAFFSDKVFNSIDEVLTQRHAIVQELRSYLDRQLPRAGEAIVRLLEQLE